MAEYAGIGTLIKRGDGASPEVFTTIAQVGDIDGPKLKAGTYDVTTHDNTLAGYKDFITGLKDGQEIKCKLFFDATAATHKDASGGILNDFNTNRNGNWQLVPAGYSPAVKWSFAAVITEIDFAYPVDGVQKGD